ncbi:hypothetical protein AVEN_12460-1 [Araneus ventricosus]|uniref:Uncharacterized protein n=1 Tax=Araneus ventricosus TaxID=182803 RepID=A0A4Y2SVI5_ARAVE|nr:hypothetical protein AVEN_12460-1 [Araneus ventricosus]
MNDVMSKVNMYQLVFIDRQETLLKPTVSAKVCGYNCSREDVDTGVCSSAVDVLQRRILSLLSVPEPLLVAFAGVVKGNLGFASSLQLRPLLQANYYGKKLRQLMGFTRNSLFLF